MRISGFVQVPYGHVGHVYCVPAREGCYEGLPVTVHEARHWTERVSAGNALLQGFGNVGGWAAELLELYGGRVVAVSDRTGLCPSSLLEDG